MILILWLMFTLLVSYVAKQRGRSPLKAFFLSLIMSPAIGFLVVVAIPSKNK